MTGSHKRHDFSKLRDSISRLKASNEVELYSKVQEAATNLENIEEGIHAFDVNRVDRVFKAITEEGKKIRTMVNKCVAQMIASAKDQSRMKRDKLTKILAGTKIDLKAGSDFDKTIYELNKTRNDANLLKSLQKLIDDIAKLTIEPLPTFPSIQYTAKSASDKDIQQLFGIFQIR